MGTQESDSPRLSRPKSESRGRELAIAVLLVAILAATVIPLFRTNSSNQKSGGSTSSPQALVDATNSYYKKNGNSFATGGTLNDDAQALGGYLMANVKGAVVRSGSSFFSKEPDVTTIQVINGADQVILGQWSPKLYGEAGGCRYVSVNNGDTAGFLVGGSPGTEYATSPAPCQVLRYSPHWSKQIPASATALPDGHVVKKQ